MCAIVLTTVMGEKNLERTCVNKELCDKKSFEELGVIQVEVNCNILDVYKHDMHESLLAVVRHVGAVSGLALVYSMIM